LNKWWRKTVSINVRALTQKTEIFFLMNPLRAAGKTKQVINEKSLEATYGIKVKIVTSEGKIKEEQIRSG
jgi:ABC-type cobalamin/Fe3+-siderophores transport system ATPase subunit